MKLTLTNVGHRRALSLSRNPARSVEPADGAGVARINREVATITGHLREDVACP